MCLILFALKTHPDYELIFIGNRDEFYNRPTARAGFWPEAPHLLAGRDLSQGGTWFGVTKYGRIAAITNYRDIDSDNAPSRGLLVSRFLRGHEDPADYLAGLIKVADVYNGFNLIIGDREGLFWYSNRGRGVCPIEPGIHGLSNHLLDTPWPKTIRGKDGLANLILNGKEISPAHLFQFLRDRSVADDKDLPQTGVTLEWERTLSPIFVSSPTYGTRSSTVLLIDSKGHATFIERTYNGDGEHFESVEYEFDIEP